MADTDQQRTERPTQKRLEEARRRGQIPRSPELSTAAVVLMGAAGLHFLGPRLIAQLHQLMQGSFALSREQLVDESLLVPSLTATATRALLACAPLFALTLAAALLAPLALGGWNFSFEALVPDFTRLSPLAGLRRMLSLRGAVELGKAFAKFLVVAAAAALYLRTHAQQMLALGSEPLGPAMAHSVQLLSSALLALAGSLALIAAVDVPWQLWQYTERLRMSRHEIRDELRESDGSPETKGRLRRIRQEFARRRMMQEVPRADVVVVNPTHFAVALRYDERRMRAPIVVAKGADEVAARIRDVATEHRVPVFEAPPLARALHRAVPIGEEIPASLYVAVAQVLTYVYQLRTARVSGGPPPPPPPIDPDLETRH